MKTQIESRLTKTLAALDDLNHAGWTRGRTWTPEVRAAVETIQDNLIRTADRCRYVLRVRYGIVTH